MTALMQSLSWQAGRQAGRQVALRSREHGDTACDDLSTRGARAPFHRDVPFLHTGSLSAGAQGHFSILLVCQVSVQRMSSAHGSMSLASDPGMLQLRVARTERDVSVLGSGWGEANRSQHSLLSSRLARALARTKVESTKGRQSCC